MSKGMMGKTFVKGNIYVFSKKKYLRDMGRKNYISAKGWVNECNGRRVTFDNNGTEVGDCSHYNICRAWCKCIGQESK